jgi:hypothetical protein
MGMGSEITGKTLKTWFEQLTGQQLPIADDQGVLDQVATSLSAGQSIGYSQFNELLLNVGYDRVSQEFFFFLCDPEVVSIGGSGSDEISSPDALESGITAFRSLALLLYGNIKHGFKTLSDDSAKLSFFLGQARHELSDRDFRSRHGPLVPLKKIDGDQAYLLGYISAEEISDGLKKAPDDEKLLKLQEQRNGVIARGRWNHGVYLTSDYLDVYVATSMRERHEYVFVSQFMSRIEGNSHVQDLRLRFFDPTQAYCPNRIDKGLAEALMLKRAACTVYLAQESDTLGKDSELASTLAQGKPVIALVPKMTDNFWEFLYGTFRQIRPEEDEIASLIRILEIYTPNSAWHDRDVIDHLSSRKLLDADELRKKARDVVGKHYDKRARVLKDTHPLALQTNLNTGVANGVLVVRSIDTCAQLIRRILLNKMEFAVEDAPDGYVLLREKLTDCVFRVMTSDKQLTNSFWNFYNVA